MRGSSALCRGNESRLSPAAFTYSWKSIHSKEAVAMHVRQLYFGAESWCTQPGELEVITSLPGPTEASESSTSKIATSAPWDTYDVALAALEAPFATQF